jgi:tetratricopeptide (TPR) repeat protein
MEAVMERKKQILRLANYTHSCMLELIDQTPPEQREAPGEPLTWTLKDHLAHIAHWKCVFNHRLQKRDPQEKHVTDIDKENARIFELHKNKTWTEVLKMMESADEDLNHQVKLLSEDELNSTTILNEISSRELWKSVLNDVCVHPISHYCQLYVEAGSPDKALAIHEKIFEDLQSMDDSSKWQATNIYNLACVYSIAGYPVKAIEQLKEALHRRPDLMDWSKNDPDLNNIRELEGYKQLYLS